MAFVSPGTGNHIKSHRADTGHSFQFLQRQSSGLHRINHSLIFTDRNKRTAQALPHKKKPLRRPFLPDHLTVPEQPSYPGAPACSRPISQRISATLSPMAGVGARDRSIIPNGIFSPPGCLLRHQLSDSGNLKSSLFDRLAQYLKISAPSLFPEHVLTTPGPLTPTLITASPSVTPWNAPAMNGLSSGALQNTTSFAHPRESCLLCQLRCLQNHLSHQIRTASISIPVLVDPTFTELQTRLRFCQRLWNRTDQHVHRFWSCLWLTNAEYPPIKFTPTFFAARSMRSGNGHIIFRRLTCAGSPTRAIGVTEILLFTIGIPYSFSISCASCYQILCHVW